MNKHTPGPWIYDSENQTLRTGKNGKAIASFEGCTNHPANKNLIAAAPNLLKLAKLILKEWEQPSDGIQRGELIGRLSQYSAEARDVIAMAEGTK